MHNPHVARYYLAAPPGGEDATSAEPPPPPYATSLTILGVVLSFLAVLLTLVLSFVFVMAPKDLSSQFIVYTGQLTREWGPINGYPVTISNATSYTRLYYCMMDSDIGKEKCGNKSPVVDYQECIESLHDCGMSLSGGWPRDYGFLTCLQGHFNVTVTQTNQFLTCLDSSEGVMVEVFQNSASSAFLGSYNYVALLLTALTVMSSFVVGTGGGIFSGGKISESEAGHIRGLSPLSYYFVGIAFVWNFAGLIAVLLLDFSKTSPVEDFPVTLWTTFLTLGVMAMGTAFFGTYLVEWLSDLYWGANDMHNYSQVAPESSGGDPSAPMVTASRASFGGTRQRFASRSGCPLAAPRAGSGYLGVQLSSGAATDDNWRRIGPVMAQTFAWCWVIVDGILFVGMLHPQTSVLNSYAVRVFFSITSARLLQLSYAYFFNAAFFNGSIDPSTRWTNKASPKEFGVQVTSLFVYLASLPCLVDAVYHFAWSLPYLAESVPSGRGKDLMIMFIVLIVALPEFLRCALLVGLSVMRIDAPYILAILEFIFAWDWITRAIMIISTLATVSAELRDEQAVLTDFKLLFI